jgi:UDP-N-acetylglucosamine--N-acetylmuramyl-(pentapeptide) pyrophosphoryl-undecaprenol N-acetylglucosamine transferase
MRILISGGGSGGHIYPALAVATRLHDEYKADILYLGSDDGLETTLVPKAGLHLEVIKAGKLQRYVSWKTLEGLGRVPVGMGQAIGVVRKFRPDVAFTSGGYVAVPTGLAARLNSVPLLMHQQDVPPNLSNTLLAPLATHISVAFQASMPYFAANKTLLLGNPVRQEILDVRETSPQEARTALKLDPNMPLLLVTGGSQGARHLNQIVCRALPQLLQNCQVLQISGQKLFNETRDLAAQSMAGLDEQTRKHYRLEPYLSEEMPLALQAAELVICRAGAATLSELAVLQKPSVLVPLPPAIGSSPQEKNAETFRIARAADVIRNDALEPGLLVERVYSIIAQPTLLPVMKAALAQFAKPSATADIAETIVKMAHGSKTSATEQEVINI